MDSKEKTNNDELATSEALKTHDALVNLGKELNKIDTIKNNNEMIFKKVMDELKNYKIESLDNTSSYDTIMNEQSNKLKDIEGLNVNSSPFILDQRTKIITNLLTTTLIAIYFLESRLSDSYKELELSKDTEQELSEQYDESIEEVEALEKEIENINRKNKNNYLLISLGFILYNYFLFFSLDEMFDHISVVIYTLSLMIYPFRYLFETCSLTSIVLIIQMIAVVIYVSYKKYKEKED